MIVVARLGPMSHQRAKPKLAGTLSLNVKLSEGVNGAMRGIKAVKRPASWVPAFSSQS